MRTKKNFKEIRNICIYVHFAADMVVKVSGMQIGKLVHDVDGHFIFPVPKYG